MAVVDHREEAVLGPGACCGGQDDEVRYEANLQPGFKVSVKGKRRGGVRARPAAESFRRWPRSPESPRV